MNTKRMNSQTETPNQSGRIPDLSGKSIPALLALVDEAILKKAAEGDVEAARLCYQRFEGWSAKGKGNFNVEINEA